MLTKLSIPIIPNKVLNANSKMPNGEVQLAQNTENELVINRSFDSSLFSFDETYQNEVPSETFINHMHDVYEFLKNNFKKGSTLIEVGCGKGEFLKIVKNDNHFLYSGFDTSYEGDDPFIKKRYLNDNDNFKADIVLLRHCIDYIESPHKYLHFLKKIFNKEVKVLIETANFNWIKDKNFIYDLTPERVSYWTKKALCGLFDKVQTHRSVFSDQYQFLFTNLNDLKNEFDDNFLTPHDWNDLDLSSFYREIEEFLDKLSESNPKRIWLWGGGSRGVIFLHHFKQINPKLFKKTIGVIDINSKKHNLYTPSTNLKFLPPETLFKKLREDDYILVSNSNYFEEIKKMIVQKTSKLPNLMTLSI